MDCAHNNYLGSSFGERQIMTPLSEDWSSSSALPLTFLLCFLSTLVSFLCIQATVLSMLSVSLLLNTQSPASSQSPTRRSIPSARRNCWRLSMRVNTLLSSYGTHPSTRCRGTTSLSSRRWYPPTTCVWDVSAEVRCHALDMRHKKLRFKPSIGVVWTSTAVKNVLHLCCNQQFVWIV